MTKPSAVVALAVVLATVLGGCVRGPLGRKHLLAAAGGAAAGGIICGEAGGPIAGGVCAIVGAVGMVFIADRYVADGSCELVATNVAWSESEQKYIAVPEYACTGNVPLELPESITVADPKPQPMKAEF